MNPIPVQGGEFSVATSVAFPAWVLWYAAFGLLHTSHLDHSLELCHLYLSEEDKNKTNKKTPPPPPPPKKKTQTPPNNKKK